MLCQAIHEHFVQAGTWVNWNKTTDSFKVGDPDRTVTRLATVWNPTWPALRLAHQRGAELVVAHESVFVRGGAGSEAEVALDSEQDKLRWIQDTGLVIYRCHDVWDNFPGIGIREHWQQRLELGGRIVADRFPLLLTEMDQPRTVRDLARHLLALLSPLGQTHVQVAGDLDRPVRVVASGTGVTVDPMTMWKLGAEVGIMTDDYFLFVREGAHAAEQGFPMIFVNHGVAEEWGIEQLAAHLARTFPDLDVFHLPQTCPYVTLANE